MKKIFAFLIVSALIFSLVGCNLAGGADTEADTQPILDDNQTPGDDTNGGESDNINETHGNDILQDRPEPPRLTVVYGDVGVEASSHSVSWSWTNADGTLGQMNASGYHPLSEEAELETVFISGEQDRVILAFDSSLPPNSVEIRCWEYGQTLDSIEYTVFDITLTEPEKYVDIYGGYSFELENGSYVYELICKWSNGGVCFGFKTEITE